MKMNKKLVVPFLASVCGLSIAGGLGGAFAWYQFNSQVRTSFIGTSVAEAGILQIGYLNDQNQMVWGRDRIMPDVKMVPVTFGALGTDGSLGQTAYGYPEAGKQLGNGYSTGWSAVENGKGFYQYDIYLRALKSDAASEGDPTQGIAPGYKLAAQDVYMSKLTLEDASHANPDDGAYIANALRVHLNVNETGGKKVLISKQAITAANPLNLYGALDLDGDGQSDKYDVDNWESNYGTTCTYGINGQTQITKGISDIIQERDSDGMMPSTATEKLICTTKTGAEMTKITVTVWLEGWSLLKVNETSVGSNIWNPHLNSGMKVHVGMVFDAGRNILG
jgi:hypothetical protein